MATEGQTHIRVRACSCPGTPHPEGDYVDLAPDLSMAGGLAGRAALVEGAGDPVRLAELLAHIWISHGVIAWNLLDEDGEPRALGPSAVEAEFPFAKGGEVIADACDALYADSMIAPLVARLKRLSPRGSTNGAQKPISVSSPSTRQQRRRSSRSTTAATEQPTP